MKIVYFDDMDKVDVENALIGHPNWSWEKWMARYEYTRNRLDLCCALTIIKNSMVIE